MCILGSSNWWVAPTTKKQSQLFTEFTHVAELFWHVQAMLTTPELLIRDYKAIASTLHKLTHRRRSRAYWRAFRSHIHTLHILIWCKLYPHSKASDRSLLFHKFMYHQEACADLMFPCTIWFRCPHYLFVCPSSPPTGAKLTLLEVLSESGMRSITMNIFEEYWDGYPRLYILYLFTGDNWPIPIALLMDSMEINSQG